MRAFKMSKIKVALRTRPLSLREKEEGHPVVVEVETNSAFITDIRVPEKPAADSRQRFRQFDLDHGFWLTDCGEWGASQEEVYNEMGPHLEKSILEGYNACLLAYGQSGTGKTHTMLGTKADPGFIPRLCQSLWEKLRESRENSDFKMEVSFMEIYREKVRDLLTPDKPLKLREHPQNGPHVQDLTRVEVSEEIGLVDLLWEGERRRAIGTTGSNRRSSRSHAIWTLYLTYHKGPDYHNLITNQVHLVDLAGSEKAELTTTKNLLAEGADINRSLVSLGNVISSLAEKAQHIPYRDSALTWLLKDSLGGNATTSIIITASPASCCHAQTLNSLRFAQRARLVENQPKVNLSTEDHGHRKGSSTLRGAASIVSIFDIRKDISRLANILKVAQNNGGILRGLTPRNGWTRLITAIESWNVVHGENENPDGESSSIDTMASTPATTSTASTMTNANNSLSTKSLNDVMVQADLRSFEDLRRGSVVSNPMPSTSSSSSPLSGSQKSHRRKLSQLSDAGQSSLSGSIKCLTWSQSELSTLPILFDDLTDEEFNNLISPPTPKIHHLKNKFPVHVVPTQNLDPVSRINEKIHGTLNCSLPEPLHIVPKIVKSDCENNFVLIRHRLATLVNPQRVGVDFVDDTIKRRNSSPTRQSEGDKVVRKGPSPGPTSPSNALNDVKKHANSPSADGADGDQQNNKIPSKIFQNFEPQPPKTFLVCNKASAKKRTHRPPPKIKEFIFGKPEKLHVFESTDEGEFSDCLEIQLNHSANKSYRTVNKAQVEIHEANIPTDEDSLEEILLFYSGSGASSEAGCEGRESAAGSPVSLNSKKSKSKSKSNKKSKSKSPVGVTSGNSNSSSPSSSSSSSSSSSYESLVFQRPSGHVKVVENSIYEFIEDQIGDVQLEDFKNLEMQVTAVSFGQIEEAELSEAIEEETEPILGLLEEDGGQAGDHILQPLDGSTNSKFHNFYVRELSQLEQIGKQIKSLRNLSQRYDVLKPYLKQIEDLQSVDWTKEDPELDAQIEHCSGWNVEIEHRKVQNEVVSISKILKGSTPTPAAAHLGQIMSSGLLNTCSFPNTGGAPNGNGGGGGSTGGVPRRDSSSTSNRTTSSTSITSDSYSLSASATNTDSRRGSFASSSFVFDPNPSQHSYPHHQLSNQNPSYHFSPSNSNSNSNSNFSQKYPTPSNFLDLDNSILFSSLSSAPNSLPSLFSLNLSQNQIPNQQNSNSNNGKISNSVSHNPNNLNFYQQQQQQQQCFSQQQQPPYFQPPLNFDYRRRGGGGGSGSGSGCNMNIENPTNPHQSFELSSPSRQNFNPSNNYNGDIPNNGFYSSSASHSQYGNNGFYSSSASHSQYGNNGYHNGALNGFGNGSSSSSNIHNNYPQKGFGGGNPGSSSGSVSGGVGVGGFKTSDFQMFNNQSQSSVSNSGRGHYPHAEIISSQNSLNQNSSPNSVLVNNSSCPNVHENGYQSHQQQQQPFYQQSQQIVQRSPVAAIPVIPIVPIVPGPTPNSWSPAHNHNFNLTPTHTTNYNHSFYGNGNGLKMNGGGSGVESGGGGSIYTNTTPPTKLNGVVKNATAFDFDPLKYTDLSHYNHDEVPSLFQIQSQTQCQNGMTPTSKFSFPNTNPSYGNGVVNRFSPPDHHQGHHHNGVDGLLLDPSSTSLTGGFSNLSLTTSASSACKSCSMDFCSCQASLSSTLTKTSDRSHLQPQKQSGFSFEFSPQITGQAQKSRGQRLSGKMQSPTHPHPPLSTGTGGKGKGGGTTNGNSSNNKRHAYPHHRAKPNNNYNHSRTAATATMISSYD